MQGSAYVTEDLDIVYERSAENVERLVTALKPFEPRLRVLKEPSGLALPWDARMIANGDNFTLQTRDGDWFDLLGTIAPGWRYLDLAERGLIEKRVSGISRSTY